MPDVAILCDIIRILLAHPIHNWHKNSSTQRQVEVTLPSAYKVRHENTNQPRSLPIEKRVKFYSCIIRYEIIK